MRNFTTPKFHELTAQGGGKNPSVTPGASIQTTQFALTSLPAGKQQKFWYYVEAAIVKVVAVINQPASGATAINPDKLWKIMATFSMTSPILGELFAHRNTKGSVLGNIMQVLAGGYKALPFNAQVSNGSGNTTVTLWYRLPFSMGILKKAHETAPWAGLLEGGTLECKCDVTTSLDGDSTGATVASVNYRAALELQPQPEAVIHTPAHFRDYDISGGGTRFTLTDLGAPDGLKGVDISRGAGLAALFWLANPTGLGLGGADTCEKIQQLDLNWRDQDRIETPELLVMSMYNAKPRNQYGNLDTPTGNDMGWPYSQAAASVGGDFMKNTLMFFPIVFPGYELETSKLQTVRGARDINMTFSATPSARSHFLSLEFPVFEPSFADGLKDLLLGGSNPDATLAPKTLNKQVGGTHGVGKLAYVRQKVTAK